MFTRRVEAGHLLSDRAQRPAADYVGSYQHEEQDAKMWADWGIDYLKYDMCSMGRIINKEAHGDPQEARRARHRRLREDASRRCLRPDGRSSSAFASTGGMRWKWGPEVGGNLWRTTGDISDNYTTDVGDRFPQCSPVARMPRPATGMILTCWRSAMAA